MSNFDGELIISYDHKASKILQGDYYRVRKSFRYYLPTAYLPRGFVAANNDRWVFVAAGMLTDLGTIPKAFRGAINPAGSGAQAFVLHDQLCEYLSVTKNGYPERIERAECDLILRSALLDLGASHTLATLIYNCVASYAAVMQIRDPSTYAIKRRLEAEYNFEDFQ